MQHFPIFLDTAAARVVVTGGGDAAVAKLRLLLKTQARIEVFAPATLHGAAVDLASDIEDWASAGRLALHRRALVPCDLIGARLVYGAAEDAVDDARTRALGHRAGVLVNIHQNLGTTYRGRGFGTKCFDKVINHDAGFLTKGGHCAFCRILH
jgi:uroporphyrin-III C-methyltransferase/precorrin-2 dehydrogenase/sirohydrochlorin ferrochelatase